MSLPVPPSRSFRRSILLGLCVAVLSGLSWAVALGLAPGHTEWLACVVGILVGATVAHRSSPPPLFRETAAALLTLAACLAGSPTGYVLAQARAESVGLSTTVRLVSEDPSLVGTIYREYFHPAHLVFWVLALVAAVWTARGMSQDSLPSPDLSAAASRAATPEEPAAASEAAVPDLLATSSGTATPEDPASGGTAGSRPPSVAAADPGPAPSPSTPGDQDQDQDQETASPDPTPTGSPAPTSDQAASSSLPPTVAKTTTDDDEEAAPAPKARTAPQTPPTPGTREKPEAGTPAPAAQRPTPQAETPASPEDPAPGEAPAPVEAPEAEDTDTPRTSEAAPRQESPTSDRQRPDGSGGITPVDS